uniref:Ig-like domain-containing protein n=1 Tax=Rattus norvegicus TaxID=10116 RepID=A0ABK0M2M2_RAT
EVQLQQSGDGLVRPGASVKMSCKASRYTFTSSAMHWVKKRPGQKFKDRVILTANSSSNRAYMELSRLTSEKSVVYYCARHSVLAAS